MIGDTYALEFDEKTGRAFVDVTGPVNPTKIQDPFLEIVSTEKWHHGDRTVLWQCEAASIPAPLKFNEVLNSTQTTRLVAGTGKSAILLREGDRKMKAVADFYRSIAVTKTKRKIEIFYSRDKALAWLDS